ncbi:MAG: hypothetical protein ABIH59_03070 [archaeon]
MVAKKGFGELFNKSLSEFGKKFVMILKAFVFLYFIPAAILMLIFGLILLIALPEGSINVIFDTVSSGFTSFDFSSLPGLVWLIILFVLMILILIILMVLMNISYIHIAFLEKEKSFKDIFGVAKKFFWRYLGLGIVTTVLLAILFILLIVPGIIFLVFWIFASYVLIKEDKGIWESLKKSKEIVKGKWWRTFGFVILISLISIVVSLISNFIPFIGGFITTLVLTPFVTIFFKNFYLDMKKK